MPPRGLGDSDEKQYVRQHLWMPVFDHLNPNTARYLNFPGADCLFLEDLRSAGKVLIENAVSVERSQLAYTKIQEYYAMHWKPGKKHHIFQGQFRDLVQNNPKFRDLFPFDVVDLDYYGSALDFGNDPNMHSDFFSALVETFTQQKAKRLPPFVLLLTIKVESVLPGAYQADYNSLSELYRKLVLSQKADSLGAALAPILALDENSAEARYYESTCAVVCKLSEHAASTYGLEFIAPPMTYVGATGNHETRMVAMAFRCTRRTGHSWAPTHPTLVAEQKALIESIRKTKWIRWNATTGTIETEDADL